MMDIDWDKAPEDAQEFGTKNGYFYKKENGIWFYWKSNLNEPWAECCMGEPLVSDRISRPTKPAAPEWDGETWPIPIGAKFKNSFDEERVVVAHDHDLIVCRCGGGLYRAYDQSYASRLRPIRTKEQRERDELIDLLRSTPADVMFGQFDDAPETLADAILAKYELKERD